VERIRWFWEGASKEREPLIDFVGIGVVFHYTSALLPPFSGVIRRDVRIFIAFLEQPAREYDASNEPLRNVQVPFR
jgi:hypothetical protein